MSLPPQVADLAEAMQDAAETALRSGIEQHDFWFVVTSFVGYAVGNHPANDRDAIVNGVDVISREILRHALARRAEIVGSEVVS